MAKSHIKQPPEAEVARDKAFPSDSYEDQSHFQVWNLLVWRRPHLIGVDVYSGR